jgi:hypothetical protein
MPETTTTEGCDARMFLVSGTSAIPFSVLCVLCGEKRFYGIGFTPVGEDCSTTM